MGIEEFIAETLVDFYEQMLLATEQVENTDEFDSLFYDENGDEISEIEFVSKYCDEINDEDLIDGVYYYLIEEGCHEEYDVKKILAHLIYKYIYNNYGDKKLESIFKFLKTEDVNNVIHLFVSNEMFGKSIITSYIENFNKEINYEKVREDIEKNNDNDLLNRWIAFSGGYCSLNEYLRKVVVSLYDYYISNGCDDIVALNNVWAFFTRNFDPLGELDETGIDFNTKQLYKTYLLKIIYSDVYEDITNDSIIKSINYDDRMTDVVVITMLNMEILAIPGDESIRNRIMKHFILLQDEKKKRKSNRDATFKNGRGPVLKKYNPGYFLDYIDFYQ